MRVYAIPTPFAFPGEPPKLFMHAENKQEEDFLELLIEGYQTTNAGKDGTDRWQHVGIELRPLEERDGKAEK